MAQCPNDGTMIKLDDPASPKTCKCPVCGAWVYPHMVLTTDKIDIEFEEETVFGRADLSGLDNSNTVSRSHVRFYPTEAGWNLVALSQSKSTEVNNKSVNKFDTVSLHDGDTIKIGSISLSVSFKKPPS